MIRKIKIRFLILAMSTLFVLLAAIITGMNLINYNSLVAEADQTLGMLSENKGTFPDFGKDRKPALPPFMSMETPHDTRYFSVLVNGDGRILQTDTSRISAVDVDTAVNYAQTAAQNGSRKAFLDQYRFLIHPEGGATRIIFMDCSRRLYTFRSFLLTSICMASGGYLAFFGILLFFSGRILRPVTESYEKQKRFITDAGHEIKTPLAILRANAEVLEMEYGENEWLSEICNQVSRLTALTSDLVLLSRMEEADTALGMIEFPFSDVVSETAVSFQAMAQTKQLDFQIRIPGMLSWTGNEKAIRQLVSILLDNAVKYTPEEGSVQLTVEKEQRSLALKVRNTTARALEKKELARLFDRFYRGDPSRNSEDGGSGIGLSVAQAIVAAHGGRISARTPEERVLELCVLLPIQGK